MSMRILAPLGLAFGLAATSTAFAQESSKKTQTTATKPAATAPAASERGRDWNRIDTNRDGLVSPEEMEAWLAANPGPLRK